MGAGGFLLEFTMNSLNQQHEIAKAHTAAHTALARTEQAQAATVARLQQIAKTAEAKSQQLTEQMDELERRADSAVGEERDTAHRAYLAAQTSRYQANQVFHRARRQLALASNQ